MAYDFALITGATSGIGEAFARRLPAGTGLLLTGRDEARLAALAGELETGGRRVETLAADLSQAEGREALIARTLELPVDLLINNAGFGRFGLLAENAPQDELDMIDVNCMAPVQLTRALLPAMAARAAAESRRAGIIVVASTVAFFPLPRLATYAATKAFDLVFAEGLAGELAGQPVDVLALCPGPTDTRFFARAGLAGPAPLAMASAEQVAREGLRALGRRNLHVVGGANRAALLAARLAPRSWLRAGARGAMARLAGIR